MGSKSGAKGVQLDGVIHYNLRRAIKLDGYRHGIAAKIEELMEEWARKIIEGRGLEWDLKPPARKFPHVVETGSGKFVDDAELKKLRRKKA